MKTFSCLRAQENGSGSRPPVEVGRPKLVARSIQPKTSPLGPRGVPAPSLRPPTSFLDAESSDFDFYGGPVEVPMETEPTTSSFDLPPSHTATVGTSAASITNNARPIQAPRPEVRIEPPQPELRSSAPTAPHQDPPLSPSHSLSLSLSPSLSPSPPPALKRVAVPTSHSAVATSGIQDKRRALTVSSLSVVSQGMSVLEDVEFSASKGELLGIAGLGARSIQALFEVIQDVRKPSEGFCELGSLDEKDEQQQLKPKCGWLRLHHAALVEQPWPLLGDGPTAREILTNAARLLGLMEPQSVAARFEDLMGLSGTKPQSLGWELPYRIRLATALVLMPNPQLLLADFPTRDLGPENAQWVWSILEQYQDDTGATILVASNDLAELERLCDRVILFADRHIVGDSSPTDLAQRMGREDLMRDFLEPANLDR